MSTPRRSPAILLAASLAFGAVALSGCGSSKAAPSTTTLSQAQKSVAALVTASLFAGGVPTDDLAVATRISAVDPTWAWFRSAPTKRGTATFRGDYGFAQKVDGAWHIVGSGTALVGCAEHEGDTVGVVPTKVLSGFGYRCPAALPATTTTKAPPTTTTTKPAGSSVSAVIRTVTAMLVAGGTPASSFTVSVTVGSGDPSWALFKASATPAAGSSFQGVYGYAHEVSATWSVAAYGTAQVGCPMPGRTALVPLSVITGFGGTCPQGQ